MTSHRITWSIGLLPALLFASLSCQSILGLEEGVLGEGGSNPGVGGTSSDVGGANAGGTSQGGSSVSNGGAGTGGSGGTAPCDQCVPLEMGWYGPIAYHLGGTAPACAPDWPNTVLDGGTAPTGAAHTCSCSCAAPTGFSCGSTTTLTLYSGPGCSMSTAAPTVATDGQCHPISGISSASFNFSAVASLGGTCTAMKTPLTMPPWTWSDEAIGCEAPNPAPCSGGVCLPATPASFELCVYQPMANATCPAAYPVDRSAFMGVNDSRQCECSCGNPGAGSCGMTVSIYSNSNCGMLQGSGTSGCIATSSTVIPMSARATSNNTTTATCNASAPNSTGTVTGSMPHTICCMN